MAPRPAPPWEIKTGPPEEIAIEEGRGGARPWPPPPRRRRRWRFWKRKPQA